MERGGERVIRVAAALIEDGNGRLLLVRKSGTHRFMQPGGKLEAGESARAALVRELGEEVGLTASADALRHLGRFSAPAANERGFVVDAEIFHLRCQHPPRIGLEIEEAVWVSQAEAAALPLAPLTRDHILPLLRTLGGPSIC